MPDEYTMPDVRAHAYPEGPCPECGESMVRCMACGEILCLDCNEDYCGNDGEPDDDD